MHGGNSERGVICVRTAGAMSSAYADELTRKVLVKHTQIYVALDESFPHSLTLMIRHPKLNP